MRGNRRFLPAAAIPAPEFTIASRTGPVTDICADRGQASRLPLHERLNGILATRVGRLMAATAAALVVAACWPAGAAAQSGGYAGGVVATPGLKAYWRLGETSGTVATDRTGSAPGSYLGGAGLGARGALRADPDTAVRFDGVDDEMQTGNAVVGATGTVEGGILGGRRCGHARFDVVGGLDRRL